MKPLLTPALKPYQHQIERLSILGVGSDLRADDGAGVLLIQTLRKSLGKSYTNTVQLVEGGSAPENCTGEINAFRPSHLLLVDAADLRKTPGTCELLPLEALAGGISFSSHTLPLAFIINYILQTTPCTVLTIGIQPKELTAFAAMSPEVKRTVAALAKELKTELPQLLKCRNYK
jgi:hydrogenase 3 maturation protease